MGLVEVQRGKIIKADDWSDNLFFSHARGLALWMAMSTTWNISTTFSWIARKFGTNIHVSQGWLDFCDTLYFSSTSFDHHQVEILMCPVLCLTEFLQNICTTLCPRTASQSCYGCQLYFTLPLKAYLKTALNLCLLPELAIVDTLPE